MAKNTKKVIKIITTIMLVILMMSTLSPVFAADDQTKVDPSIWKSQTGNKLSTDGVKQWIASIMNIVAIVGSGIAVIALIVLGIKYMMGSVEEKAEYKKTLMPYVIGALMVFGASAIVGFIANAIG